MERFKPRINGVRNNWAEKEWFLTKQQKNQQSNGQVIERQSVREHGLLFCLSVIMLYSTKDETGNDQG